MIYNATKYREYGPISYCGHWSSIRSLSRTYYIRGSCPQVAGSDGAPTRSCCKRSIEGAYLRHRLRAVTRLFRIILDVTSPAFSVEDRQWQSSIVDIFYYFFSAMWSDERVNLTKIYRILQGLMKLKYLQEEIRVAVETFSASLLPAHFGAISACWSESISKTPIKERIRLISFLIQLRPHFPTWKGKKRLTVIFQRFILSAVIVLSWEAAIEALLEESYGDMEAYNEDTPVAARLVSGLSPLCVFFLTSVL